LQSVIVNKPTSKPKKNSTAYYTNKVDLLKDIFGSEDVILEEKNIIVNGLPYPVIDDVIIILDPSQYPPSVREILTPPSKPLTKCVSDFAEDIQFTFGAEWLTYSDIKPEHEEEFSRYFDIVDISELTNLRVCDLGCGIGRWSYFLKDKCRELILVDFSEAIFAARNNLVKTSNAVFFMGDLTRLPFRNGFADFLYCLGVLHHLPVNALDQVRNLKKYAPKLLIYLYYALDNRPFHFRALLAAVTLTRKSLVKIRSSAFRSLFSKIIAAGVYLPIVLIGKLLKPIGLSHFIPLEYYEGMSISRIQQDVYDRFFTSIEQRFTKKQILELRKSFETITISEHLPYWHFKCENPLSSHDNQN
jgi:SAM-dependent methyltransferase